MVQGRGLEQARRDFGTQPVSQEMLRFIIGEVLQRFGGAGLIELDDFIFVCLVGVCWHVSGWFG